MSSYVLVALGGALGSMGRFGLANLMVRLTGPDFPWGTILINILGSFVIGWFSALTTAGARFPASSDTRAFVMAGICGGFTTFSAFSLQTAELLRTGQWARACFNVGASVLLCVTATLLGLFLARQ